MTIALLLTACGGAIEEPQAEIDQDAYIHTQKKWPNPSKIPVCWENWSAANEGKKWVRAAVEQAYERRAEFKVDFTGWGTCTSGSKGIRIQIADVNPAVSELGKDLDGKKNGMQLNFQFNNFGTTYCQMNAKRTKECIATIAIHEFAHALGMAHEQNRDDTPAWCDQEQGSDGNQTVGGWDVDSVTNYCNPQWNGDGILSEGDVSGLAVLYPHPNGRAHENVFFRNYYGEIEQFYSAPATGWRTANLSDIAGGPAAVGDPSTLSYESTQHVFYRNTNGRISQLYWSAAPGWQHYEVGGISGAPLAGGDPKAVALPGAMSVFYRSTSGDLVQLWWTSSTGWQVNNLATTMNAPSVSGNPAAYAVAHSYQVTYRDALGRVIHLDWEPVTSWNLVVASAPSAGDVAAKGELAVFSNGIWQYVFYRGVDDHVHQLWRPYQQAAWNRFDLTAATGAPLAAGDLGAYPYYRTQHVFYRNPSASVSELWWTSQNGWAHATTGANAGAPTIVGRPFGLRSGHEQHVYYRDTGGLINQLRWDAFGGWRVTRLGLLLGALASASTPAVHLY